MFAVLVVFLLTIYLFVKKKWYKWIYIISKTFKRDITACSIFFKLNFLLWRHERNNKTVAKLFTSLVRKHPDKVALYFENETWSFQDVEDFSNQVAHYFKTQGFKRGDSVALLLDSRPEYVCIWLGLAKIGVVTALINNNLVSDPLLHSLKVSDVKAIIFGDDFKKVIRDISDKIHHLKRYQLTEKGNVGGDLLEAAVDLREAVERQSISPLKDDVAKGRSREKLLFIYTSGTTGLPKAAVITNMRFFFMALGLNHMTGLTENDILYDPLPLYHSAGGLVGIGQCLLKGVTVALRRKFSASNFWSDCARYGCTAAQYIGEICRYILAAHHKDTKPVKHSVRVLVGNGLRPQIWQKFVEQFKIKEIYEFYGATEGNSNLINIDSKIGAVGFVPRYAGKIYPVTLIKCNEATGEPIRNERGFCIRCQPGESGVFIGKINVNKTVNDFAGYADKKETEKKLITNVFKKGDLFFNSGDILVQDELGYYYFKDRTGDTFRWKGENVATSEVEAVVSNVANLSDAIVYGVEIPGNEGRAGMVAIVDEDGSLDMQQLCRGLKQNLPSYAVPIFVRAMQSVPLTGTFKLKKTDLQKDGFDLDKVTDRLYFYDAKTVNYIELTRELYDDIMTGKIRL